MLAAHGVEAELDRMMQPQVNLKSGGYIIINQTEALVAIDVNSGRARRKRALGRADGAQHQSGGRRGGGAASSSCATSPA